MRLKEHSFTTEPVLGNHHSTEIRVIENDRMVAQKRLLYSVPSLFWARFGGSGLGGSRPRHWSTKTGSTVHA